MVFLMYDRMIKGVRKYFKQSKRTNDELKHKLHQMFQDNIIDFEKYAAWYSGEHTPINVTEKVKYEHYVIENYKKSVYGDSYEIKEYESIYE